MSGNANLNAGNRNQSEGPFNAADTTDIRRFCGYAAYGAFGYVWEPGYAYLDTQIAAMAPAEVAVVQNTFLPTLRLLETAVDNTSQNLDTAQAAVWTHNPNEMQDRIALYTNKRLELCEFIGCPPGGRLKGINKVMRA